jgi:hypothetical protein
MIVLAASAELVDNSLGSIPLEYSRLLQSVYTLQESLWFDIGEIQLQTRIRLELFEYGNPGRGARFLNPTSSQWGHMALVSDGYTQERVRIESQRQEILVKHPPIAIGGCRNTIPLNLGKTEASKKSHFYSIAEIPVCLKLEGLSTPPPTPSIYYGEGKIPEGTVCLSGDPGAEFYVETNPWGAITNHEITIDRLQEGWVDELSGVLYPFTSMVIAIELQWPVVTNSQLLPTLSLPIQGDAPFPVYGYGCALGNPVPAPSNPPCPPGSPGGVWFNGEWFPPCSSAVP